jgi:hypothetical protein
LQEVIQMLRDEKLDVPLQFDNFREWTATWKNHFVHENHKKHEHFKEIEAP